MRPSVLLAAAVLVASGMARAEGAPAAAAARAHPRQVQEVGFQRLPAAARVFVRTSAPGPFTIADAGERTILVRLEDTRPRSANDLRPLDTSFFGSPVARIEPRRDGTAFLVAITLRERVEYRQKVEGDVLALDFASPTPGAAVPSPAAEPPPAPPTDPPGAAPPAAPADAAPGAPEGSDATPVPPRPAMQ